MMTDSAPIPHAKPRPPLTAREVAALNRQFAEKTTPEILAWAWERFGAQAAIGTSFQGAGLVMMHLAKTAGLRFPVFTLDTGLLFPETLELKKRLEDFFGWKIESLEPDLTVEEQADVHGPELWKRNPDLCCTARKVMPLRGKLLDLACWLTGLRREQSASRADVGLVELYQLDEATGREIVKVNPMARWPREKIWSHIQEHKIPYNPLHDQGYRSIGCVPCTRMTGDGEGERAGRWTGFNKVECGIHTFLPKKVDFQI
ncbi:MAG: phosphoadenylyl-sulfate reductase [Verrucomicrobiota bacterium]|jgi:phosphoadenosine phosphosulfate reductase